VSIGLVPTIAVSAIVGALFVALLPPSPLAAYADGAPPGFSGGFGESACDACHFENDVNARPGQLTLSGVPERFNPGERYTLAVTLARPEMKVGGFQLTARLDDGGAQAGAFGGAPGDAKRVRVSVVDPTVIQYVGQTREGAGPAPPGILRWELVWTAPTIAAAVRFNVAANAGDGDDSVRGDYVYTATARTTAQP
jgi:hypothetical protein